VSFFIVVERGCAKSAGVCESEDIAATGREQADAIAWRSGAEGDEIANPVSIDQKEAAIRVG